MAIINVNVKHLFIKVREIKEENLPNNIYITIINIHQVYRIEFLKQDTNHK